MSAINPDHYRSHPSGVECIQITEHMGFLLGNAIKYIWRADLKGSKLEDLKKAEWYIQRAIKLEEGVTVKQNLSIDTYELPKRNVTFRPGQR